MRTLFSFLVCLLLWAPLNATCIVILIKDNTFYVCADSRSVVRFYSKSKVTTKFKRLKKIHVVNSTYFAISGEDDATLISTAIYFMKQKKDLNRRITMFIDSMEKRYQILLQSYYANQRDQFNRVIQKNLAEVAFFGFINGKPFIQKLYFIPSVHGDEIEISCPIVKDKSLNILGFYDHMANANSKPTTDPKQALINMVDAERNFHSNEVARPYDFLTLNNKGPKWEVIN